MADDRNADKVKGVLLPEECISLYTEHVSGKELSSEVNRALSRDTTYRMKELTHVREFIVLVHFVMFLYEVFTTVIINRD